MCTDCGDFNYAKRFQTADVKGQIAIITGSRLKIGYHIINAFARSNRYCYDPFSSGFGLRFLKEDDFMDASFKNSWIGFNTTSVEIFYFRAKIRTSIF
jgi:hypothetical protein